MSYTEGGNIRLHSPLSTIIHNGMAREECQKRFWSWQSLTQEWETRLSALQLRCDLVLSHFLYLLFLLLWCVVPISLLPSQGSGAIQKCWKDYRSTLYWLVMGANRRISTSFILQVNNSETHIKQIPCKSRRGGGGGNPIAYSSDLTQ